MVHENSGRPEALRVIDMKLAGLRSDRRLLDRRLAEIYGDIRDLEEQRGRILHSSRTGADTDG